MTFPRLIALCALLGFWSLSDANAFQLPRAEFEPFSFSPESGVDFTATVALSGCSGSLVRFTSSLGSDSAMVLTNAHCLQGGFLSPGEVIVNEPVSRSFRLLTSDGRGTLGTLSATRIIYATLTRTDIALYAISDTYDTIEKLYHVTALTIAPRHPEQARNIAIPSGYWKRIYHCAIDGFVNELHESDWSWKDSIRYTQPGCEVIGGTSGSPIVDAETHEIVGINNTGNESGERCTMNNPCEVDANGNVTFKKGNSYGQETFWMYGCLDSRNEFDLNQPGCELPKPASN